VTWVQIGLAAFALAGLIFAVTVQAEAMLSRLPGAVWPVLRGACGLATLGFAVWIGLAPDNRLARTTCHIVELELHAREGGVVDIMGRLEWTAGTEEYVLRVPMRITRDRGTPAELHERYHDKRVPCFYRTTTPNRINAGTGEQHTREQWKKAGVVALPGLGLLVLGLVGWKRRTRAGDQQRMAWLSSRGVGGTIALIALVAGLASDTTLATVLGIALFVIVFGRELLVASRALRYLQRKLTLARKEGTVLDTLSGERAGARIVVEERVDELAVAVTLPGWPGVAIQRTTEPAQPIGDPVFDLEHAVSGPDLTWRCLLTAPIRAAIGDAFVAETRSIDADGTWRAVYPDDIAKGPVIEEDIKRAIAFGELVAALPAPSPERLLAIAPDEPLAKVRLGHYRWLVESGHPAPAIALVAAQDPDAEVRAWAASIVAPSDGAFR